MTVNASLILIVEDDAKISDMLANYLQVQGYATRVCADGQDAVEVVRSHPPALVLLDLNLPRLDGVAVCTAVRGFSAVPIIMVTAKVDEVDRLLGLDTGADDYICKPFSPREVVARIKALLRRAQGGLRSAQAVAAAADGGFILHDGQLCVGWRGQTLPFTPVEFRVFRLLLSRPGQVFGRARLLDCLHEDSRDVSDRVVDSHIKNLRRKLEQAQVGESTITSVYGVGYRLDLAP